MPPEERARIILPCSCYIPAKVTPPADGSGPCSDGSHWDRCPRNLIGIVAAAIREAEAAAADNALGLVHQMLNSAGAPNGGLDARIMSLSAPTSPSATAARREERAACAEMADDYHGDTAKVIAATIRARAEG